MKSQKNLEKRKKHKEHKMSETARKSNETS